MVLVTYDVKTDSLGGSRRLRNVAKACKNHGQRVQYSVFECVVDPAQWVTFENSKVIDDPELFQKLYEQIQKEMFIRKNLNK